MNLQPTICRKPAPPRSTIDAQTFTYNGLGDRVRADHLNDTRHFVYDAQGRVIAEYGASAGDVKAEFIWALPPAANDNTPFGGGDGIVGYAPLALVAANGLNQLELYWVHGNHLGVPIVTTNALGQVTDPANAFLRPGFPGQSRVLSDLYYNRARDYDPVLGRYIQADPIGLMGDVNPYVYAGADPVNMVDPLGLEKINLFPFNEPDMRKAADRAFDSLKKSTQDSVYHIYGHGGPTRGCVYTRGGCLTGEEFAKWLQSNGFDKLKPIVLYSCNTGSIENGFAQELSNHTYSPVYAPTELVWYHPEKGITGSAPRLPSGKPNPWVDGFWRRFNPRSK